MILGIIAVCISIISTIISIIIFKRNKNNFMYYYMLLKNLEPYKDDMLKEVDKMEIPPEVNKEDLRNSINYHTDNMKKSYLNNMRSYVKYAILCFILILLNGSIAIFNIINFKILEKLAILTVKFLLYFIN